MVLLAVLPVGVIIGLTLFFYSRNLIQSGVENVRLELTTFVVNRAREIRITSREYESDVDSLVRILATDSGKADEYVLKTMKDRPRYEGVAIAYAPDFLADVKAGKYPAYKLENSYGLLSREETPAQFAPTTYRDRGGEISFLDEGPAAYESRNWYISAKELGRGIWTEPFISRITKTNVCSYSVPFYHENRFAGVVCAAFYVETLFEDNSGSGFDPSRCGGDVFILTSTGKIGFHHDRQKWQRSTLYTPVPKEHREEVFPMLDAVLSQKVGDIRIPSWGEGIPNYDPDGITWFVYAPLQNKTENIVVASFNESAILAPLHRKTLYLWLAGLGVMALLAAAVLATMATIFQPVVKLSEISHEVAAGNLNVSVPENYTQRKGVIGRLAANFNEMITGLRKNLREAVDEKAGRLLLERELSIARATQASLLPDYVLPNVKHLYYLESKIFPARYIAGDFYDYWQIDATTIAILIADVSGKGVPAAIFMCVVQTLVRHVSKMRKTLGEILGEVNDEVARNNKKHMFVTMFLAFYHLDTGVLEFTNGGHNPPALIKPDGTVEWFPRADNPIVGIFPGTVFSSREIELAPGDIAFLYTDGVTDSFTNGKKFEEARLVPVLSEFSHLEIDHCIAHLMGVIERENPDGQKDDITIMLLKRSSL